MTKKTAPSHDKKHHGLKEGTYHANEAKKGDDEFPDVFKSFRKSISNISPKDKRIKYSVLACFVMLTLYGFFVFLNSEYSAMIKFFGSMIYFMIIGEMIRGWMDWGGFYGLIMFRDKRTLSWIDKQARRYSGLWVFIADIGLVMGYGALSYFLMNKQKQNKKYLLFIYVIGFFLLILFAGFISPNALLAIQGVATNVDFTSATTHIHDTVDFKSAIDVGGTSIPIYSLVLFSILMIGGLATSIVASLIMYAIIIFPPILFSIIGNVGGIFGFVNNNTVDVPPPGGSPMIPGVNLPLVEGLLALAVLLVVHEMSHAFISRINLVRLESAGIVFFGALPFGAFVEPDEKQMEKIPIAEQNRLMVAGSAANLITAIATFFILIILITATTGIRLEGYEVTSGPLPTGSIIYSINGQDITLNKPNATYGANEEILIKTQYGEFKRMTDENAKIGVRMRYVAKSGYGFRYQFIPGLEWMEFIFNTLGLIFALNVFVGVVNLLPIPLFDGYRLMAAGVKNKRIIAIISWGVLISFIINFMPWLFK